MADKAGEYMEDHKVKFIRHAVPVKVELIEKGPPSKLRVEYKNVEGGKNSSEEYNTVSLFIVYCLIHHLLSLLRYLFLSPSLPLLLV